MQSSWLGSSSDVHSLLLDVSSASARLVFFICSESSRAEQRDPFRFRGSTGCMRTAKSVHCTPFLLLARAELGHRALLWEPIRDPPAIPSTYRSGTPPADGRINMGQREEVIYRRIFEEPNEGSGGCAKLFSIKKMIMHSLCCICRWYKMCNIY